MLLMICLNKSDLTCSEEEFVLSELVFVLVFDQFGDDVGASRPKSEHKKFTS